MRATEHTSRDPFNLLERRRGLADTVERGGGVLRGGREVGRGDARRGLENYVA